jgi:hypothetical protein
MNESLMQSCNYLGLNGLKCVLYEMIIISSYNYQIGGVVRPELLLKLIGGLGVTFDTFHPLMV